MTIIRYTIRYIKRSYLRFITLKGDPKHLAFSVSIGIFFGMMPILPFQIAAALALALIFRANKLAAALGTFISNPLNWYPVYLWCYKIGTFLLGHPYENSIINRIKTTIYEHTDTPVYIIMSLLQLGGKLISVMLIGGVVLGLIVSIPAYFLLKLLFAYIQKWRKNKKKYRKCNDTSKIQS